MTDEELWAARFTSISPTEAAVLVTKRFAHIRAATIEECAQTAENFADIAHQFGNVPVQPVTAMRQAASEIASVHSLRRSHDNT
jgi:hypothetical protein